MHTVLIHNTKHWFNTFCATHFYNNFYFYCAEIGSIDRGKTKSEVFFFTLF